MYGILATFRHRASGIHYDTGLDTGVGLQLRFQAPYVHVLGCIRRWAYGTLRCWAKGLGLLLDTVCVFINLGRPTELA